MGLVAWPAFVTPRCSMLLITPDAGCAPLRMHGPCRIIPSGNL
jgi:hypothetical protein